MITGHRNVGVHSMLTRRADGGLNEEGLRILAHKFNLENCDPPLSETEVDKIVASVIRHTRAEDEARTPVITLCGSTRFKDDFFREQERLTLDGNIVISVGLFGWDKGRPEDALGEETKLMLDQLHFRKIDISDSIHVINKDGYIGSSTRNEINYAESYGKPVTYMEDPHG